MALYVKINDVRNKGFTFIEIMFVVFIISLLSSMAILEGVTLKKKANEANAQANLKSIATSFEIYAAGHAGAYAESNGANKLQFLVDAKYATQDFIALGQVDNFRYQLGAIEPVGYDIRAIAVNPVLSEHNYQILTGARTLRSDTSVSSDLDFKNY